MSFARGMLSRETVVISIIVSCLLITALVISYFNAAMQRQLELQAVCSEIYLPFPVELDLSESNSIYTRGFELQVRHNAPFEVSFSDGNEKKESLSLLTLDAVFPNGATQMPFFTMQTGSDFGPVTAQTVNVTAMTAYGDGLSISAKGSEIHVRLDVMSFELSEMGRLKLRELSGREVGSSEVIGFSGGGEALAVFLQSMKTREATGQIFKVSFPGNETEMELVRHNNPRSATGELVATGCTSLSYSKVGADGKNKPKADKSDLRIVYNNLELTRLNFLNYGLEIRGVLDTASIRLDGHEQLQGRFVSLLARPWYEQGAIGLFALFASMIFVELLKGAVKRIAALAFGKTD